MFPGAGSLAVLGFGFAAVAFLFFRRPGVGFLGVAVRFVSLADPDVRLRRPGVYLQWAGHAAVIGALLIVLVSKNTAERELSAAGPVSGTWLLDVVFVGLLVSGAVAGAIAWDVRGHRLATAIVVGGVLAGVPALTAAVLLWESSDPWLGKPFMGLGSAFLSMSAVAGPFAVGMKPTNDPDRRATKVGRLVVVVLGGLLLVALILAGFVAERLDPGSVGQSALELPTAAVLVVVPGVTTAAGILTTAAVRRGSGLRRRERIAVSAVAGCGFLPLLGVALLFLMV